MRRNVTDTVARFHLVCSWVYFRQSRGLAGSASLTSNAGDVGRHLARRQVTDNLENGTYSVGQRIGYIDRR